MPEFGDDDELSGQRGSYANTRTIHPSEGRAPVVAGGSCLVVIHGEDGRLGQQFLLEGDSVSVGRSAESDVVLASDLVSRHHCYFERHGSGWLVRDNDSTNGVAVDGEPIASARTLTNGDRVSVGLTIFKYLTGSQIESRYHKEIYRLMNFDGLTGVCNYRHFLETLEERFVRGQERGSELALVALDIDGFRQINDMHGRIAGDAVLRAFAQFLREAIPDSALLGRNAGEEFMIALEGTTGTAARAFAEALRKQVSDASFVYRGEEIGVRTSSGCASLTDDMSSAEDLLQKADEALYAAKRKGGDQVASGRNAGVRRVLEGLSLLRRVLLSRGQSSNPGVGKTVNVQLIGGADLANTMCGDEKLPVRLESLVAFEIDDEASIHEVLGAEGYDRWLRELIDDVDDEAESTELVGSWRDRFVLLAIHDKESQPMVNRVVDRWCKRGIESAAGDRLARSLKTATLAGSELDERGDRALDAVVARLTAREVVLSGSPPPSVILPYPLAIFGALVTSRRTPFSRVRTLLDGIEMAMRFVSLVSLAAVRDYASPDQLKSVASMLDARGLVGRPLSFGGWDDLAWRLASSLPENSPAPLQAVCRQLHLKGTDRSRLSIQIKNAVTFRNELQHRSSGRDEHSYEKEEQTLSALLEEVTSACAPLAGSRLVSVAEIVSFDEDDDAIEYSLRVHQGPLEFFPVITESLSARLTKNACYLLTEGHRPLSLSPFVFAGTCDTCGRLEIAMAEEIVLGPAGAKVRACGVTSAHRIAAVVPGSKKLKGLAEFVAAGSR